MSSALLVNLVLSISWISQNKWQWTLVVERERHPEALVLLSMVCVVAVLLLLFPSLWHDYAFLLSFYPLWGEPCLVLGPWLISADKSQFPFHRIFLSKAVLSVPPLHGGALSPLSADFEGRRLPVMSAPWKTGQSQIWHYRKLHAFGACFRTG